MDDHYIRLRQPVGNAQEIICRDDLETAAYMIFQHTGIHYLLLLKKIPRSSRVPHRMIRREFAENTEYIYQASLQIKLSRSEL